MGLTSRQVLLKRSFDLTLALLGLLLTWWLILLGWITASIGTKSNGFFLQRRVGRNGQIFNIIKLRTMLVIDGIDTTVTTRDDPRITPLGKILRRFKLDELPQLFNIIIGDMSFVGPRPDVPGFADKLEGTDRLILSVRPGITGPATLKYRNEETILTELDDPEAYNRHVIYPDKVRINLEYIHNWSLQKDIRYLWLTATEH